MNTRLRSSSPLSPGGAMAYMTRAHLVDAAREVLEMSRYYSTRARGELTIDRLLFGYFRGTGHNVGRQFRIWSANGWRRIDFIVGGESSGAFVELVVRTRRNGEEWRLRPNRDEFNKLCRAKGRQRALMIIDASGRDALTAARLKQEYELWRSTPGRYARRNVCVIYCAGPDHTFSFGLKP
jgi:hypothetical protein